MATKQIRVADVIALLEAGKSRPEIKEELGLTNNELNHLFQHPKLKGRKAKKQIDMVIIDDEDDNLNLPGTANVAEQSHTTVHAYADKEEAVEETLEASEAKQEPAVQVIEEEETVEEAPVQEKKVIRKKTTSAPSSEPSAPKSVFGSRPANVPSSDNTAQVEEAPAARPKAVWK